MKATISAICILAALIGACFASTVYTKSVCGDMTKSLQTAKTLLNSENLKDAEAALPKIQEDWKKKSRVLEMFIQHEALFDVSETLTRAKAAIEVDDKETAIIELSAVLDLLERISVIDSVNGSNIL